MDKWLKDYKLLDNSSFKIFDSLPLRKGVNGVVALTVDV